MKPITVPFFISHQGCPHTCVFCDQRTITGSGGKLPSPAELLDTVASWQASSPGRPLEVAFFGGTFTALPVDEQIGLLEALRPLRANGTVRSVRISTRPDYLERENVLLLEEYGVATVEIGVQSLDDRVLEASGRGHTAGSALCAIGLLKEHGIQVVAQLMPGLPDDTLASSLDSLRRVIAAGADFIRLYPAVVIQGTELARRYRAGEYRPLGLDEGIRWFARLLHEAMKSGVQVIRIGLQADDGLNGATVVAGCWHPALGELARSRMYGDLLASLTSALPDAAKIAVRCHPSRVSLVTGHGRRAMAGLGRFAGCRVRPDAVLGRDDIRIEYFNQIIKGNIVTDLNYNN